MSMIWVATAPVQIGTAPPPADVAEGTSPPALTPAAAEAQTAETDSRPVVLTTEAELRRARGRRRDADSAFHQSWRSVKKQADAALGHRFRPQESNDVARFYARANPEARQIHALAVAYRVSGNDAHLTKARRALMAWARHANADLPADPSPSWRDFHYPGKAMPDAAGLHISRVLVVFADAYAVLHPDLPARVRQEVERWFASMRSPIQRSTKLWQTRDRYSVAPNETKPTTSPWMGRQDYSNHLAAHAVGQLAIGYATGNDGLVAYALHHRANPRDLRELFGGALVMPGDRLHRRDPSLGTNNRRWPDPLPGAIYDRYRVLGQTGVGDKGLIYASLGQRFLSLATEMAARNGDRDYWQVHAGNGENLRASYHTYAPFISKPGRATVCRGRYHEDSATSDKVVARWRAMTEMAFREYPYDPAIRAALRTAQARNYNDDETFGATAPLLKGEDLDLPGGPGVHVRGPQGGTGSRTVAPAAGADAHFLGDWNGDGVDTPGWRVGRTFHLSDSPTGAGARAYAFGTPCDEALVGDWTGNGRDSIGIRRGTTFYFAGRPGQRTSIKYSAGRASDRVVIGDWNGDGVDTPGLVRGNRMFLRTSNTTRPAYASFRFARASDRFVAGDWNGNGTDALAAVRASGESLTWFLRSGNRDDSPVASSHRHGSRYDAALAGRPGGERTDRMAVVRFRDLGVR